MTLEIGCPSGGGAGGGDNDGGGMVKEMPGRFRKPPAPFLSNTFQIVNDPNTNSIISWGESGESFIIWDHIKFSVEILPSYFRHNILSNFVYQLHKYGFRKIRGDYQWEYANKDFQKGKQHLLSNMKRRVPLQTPTPQCHRRSLSPKRPSSAIVIDLLTKEIDKMKMKQSDMASQIMALQQQINNFHTVSERERESRHCDYGDDDEVRAAKRGKVAVATDDDHEGDHGAERENVVVVSVEMGSESDGKKDEEDHQNEMVIENIDDHAAKSKSAEIDGNYLTWVKKHEDDGGFTELLAQSDDATRWK